MRKRRRTNSFNSNIPFRIPPALKLPAVFVIGILVGYGFFSNTPEVLPIEPSSVRACFTPGGNCESQIISLISRAETEILVQAYGFTSENLANALLAAHKRGVQVSVLYDQKAARERYSQIPRLQAEGIKTIPDKVKGIAHNKVFILDRKVLVTGSYNLTNAARDKNSENIVIIDNTQLANEYINNWNRLAFG